MSDDVSDLARDLTTLEGELKRLEVEYNQYFAGRLKRPPLTTRHRVEQLVKRLDRLHIPNTGDRFRFTTLQTRFARLVDLWDRGLRAKEEGRTGPFVQGRAAAAPPPPAEPTAKGKSKSGDDRIVQVASFSDPSAESEKIQTLYKSLSDARRQVGEAPIPYRKFVELIQKQVGTLKQGDGEVAFRVAVKAGKVALTARATKGQQQSE